MRSYSDREEYREMSPREKAQRRIERRIQALYTEAYRCSRTRILKFRWAQRQEVRPRPQPLHPRSCAEVRPYVGRNVISDSHVWGSFASVRRKKHWKKKHPKADLKRAHNSRTGVISANMRRTLDAMPPPQPRPLPMARFISL